MLIAPLPSIWAKRKALIQAKIQNHIFFLECVWELGYVDFREDRNGTEPDTERRVP